MRRSSAGSTLAALVLLLLLPACAPPGDDDDIVARDDDDAANDDDDDSAGDDDDSAGDDDDSAGDDDDSAGDDDDSASPCQGTDADTDGVTVCGPDGLLDTADDDCDDDNPLTHPGAAEVCDGEDNDCDGAVPAPETIDADGDGAPTCLDCDDNDSNNTPGALESCDGQDNDCDGSPMTVETVDDDGDGAILCADCDDDDASVNPGATELCDGVDTDCDGVLPADEAGDGDGDGYLPCEECDDSDPDSYPGAPELCDGADNDCDGVTPADELTDGDTDGFALCLDCDDGDATIYPGAPEPCDGIDQNCNGLWPEEDEDGDGFMQCSGDCDDEEAGIYPGALEPCGALFDMNCDGTAAAPCVDVCSGIAGGALPSSLCDAVVWAATLSVTVDWRPVIDDLIAVPTLAATSGEPQQTSTFSTGPGVGCGGPGVSETTTETWAASGSSGDYSAAGALDYADDYNACFGWPDWEDTRTLASPAGFELTWVGGSPSPDVESLELTGSIESSDTWSGVGSRYEAPDVDAVIALSGASPSGVAAVLPATTTTLDLSGWFDTWDYGSPGWIDRDGSMSLVASTHPGSTPWSASGTVDWMSSLDPSGDPDPGCWFEPISGQLDVTALSAPAGASLGTASLVFDNLSCDGCFTVLLDGTDVGLWCTDLLEYPGTAGGTPP